ncbi:MAG: ABC transporter permease [Thermoplasmata archaeon]
MRLRVFLFKRIIHTIITLLVVLVLLFVIFRLMPGDPTRFFIEPGQTEDTRNRLLVKYGFRQWADAPGIYRKMAFDAKPAGVYRITIDVEDEKQNTLVVYASYNRARTFPYSAPIKAVARVDPLLNESSDNIFPPLRMETATVGEDLVMEVTVDSISQTPSIEIWAEVVRFTNTGNWTYNSNLSFTLQTENIYRSETLTPDAEGVYVATIHIVDYSIPDSLTISYAFAANVPESQMHPFELVEGEGRVYTYQDVEDVSKGRAIIAVKSSAGKVENVNGTVIGPDLSRQSNEMIHPRITVERNVLEQFWVYFTSMLVGDFGESFYSRRPVWTEISQRAPSTILLFGSALVLQSVIGVLIGVLLAWRRGTKMELGAIVVALFFYSMPLFWFGLLLLWAFSFQLGWFPFGGMVTAELWVGGPPDLFTQFVDVARHMALPLLNLMMVGLAFTVLLMRNSMLEVLGEDYITTAKAKGLSERKVMYKHAARNAMLPVVTVIAISVGAVVSGGVLTETIFSWPGMGYYLVMSTLQQDYPAVQGVFYLLAVLTIIANVIADILYAFLDPRVRL